MSSSRPRRTCRDAATPVPATLPIDWSDDESDESDHDRDDRDDDSDFDAPPGDDGDDDSSSDEDDVEDDDDETEQFSDDGDDGDDGSSSGDDDDPRGDDASRVRDILMRELCEVHKNYDAFTTEETRWALRLLYRVDLSAYTTLSIRAFVGRAMTPETHDVDAAVACVEKIVARMRRDRLYASIFETFGGERGGVPRAFHNVDAVQLLFACLLVTKESDLFLVATPEERRAIDDALPPDVVREHIAPRVSERSVDDPRVEVIAEETWNEVRARLLAIKDGGEPDRVVRRYVGGAVAALVFARRDGFDFDAIGWIPRPRRRDADPRGGGSSIPTHGASRTARPTDDKRRVRVEVHDDEGVLARVVYAHVPRDGFQIQNVLEHAKTAYEDVAELFRNDEHRDLAFVWDAPRGGRAPVSARGPLRVDYGPRVTVHAIPRVFFQRENVVPLDFETVRANVDVDVDRAIRDAVGDDPRSGTCESVDLEYGGLGWKTHVTIRGNPNANPSRRRVLASRENKIRRAVDVARRRFRKRLEVMARRASPPTERFALLFSKNPSFYAAKV